MRKITMLNLILVLSMILSACATSVTPTTTEPTKAEPAATAVPAATKAAPEATKHASDATKAPEPTATEAAPAFNELPMLADLVKAGTLPPLDQRLPQNPFVQTPIKEVGKYGGEWKLGMVGSDPLWGGGMYFMSWEHLVAWKPDFSGVQPNVAESWEVSADAKEYTFHLRKGMKWSDGVDFTADDIVFYINDVVFNTDINKSGPVADWLPADGAADFKVTKIDDYTVKYLVCQHLRAVPDEPGAVAWARNGDVARSLCQTVPQNLQSEY